MNFASLPVRCWIAVPLVFLVGCAQEPDSVTTVGSPSAEAATTKSIAMASTSGGQLAGGQLAGGQSAGEQSASPLLLPSDERQFLWECEHRGNLLGQYGFGPFSTALKQRQREALAALFTADFQADVPASPLTDRTQDRDLVVKRVANEAVERTKLDRGAFSDWLLSFLANYAADGQRPRFELIALNPTERANLAADWTGRCRLRVTGETGDRHPCESIVLMTFRIRSPLRENLAAGGWWRELTVVSRELRESSAVLMKEVAAARGLSPETLFDNWNCEQQRRIVTVGGAYLCDYNRDGYTDVLITSEQDAHSTRFYRGLAGGRFQDVTYQVGLPDIPLARHAAFADIDGDGWEDLIFVGQAVFRNLGGKIFKNITLSSNISQLVEGVGIAGITGMTVVDFDRDGLVDLYVSRGDATQFNQGSWVDGRSGNRAGNQLLRNRGGGFFEDVTKSSGTAANDKSVFTAAWFDANNDNWPDMYLIHEFGPGALFINQQNGKFSEIHVADESADFGSMGLAAGDLDNDGNLDLYASNMYSKAGNRVMDNLPPGYLDQDTRQKLRRMVAGSQLYMNDGVNDGAPRLTPIAKQAEVADVGWAWGVALVDLNNDGWLDMHATAGFMSQDRAKPDG